MYDYLLCWHEAGHAVVGAALGLRHHARVKEDGSGVVRWDGAAFDGLHPEDRAVLAVSGNVAEAMAIDGNLKRAVKDTFELDSNDAVILRMALSELPAWKYPPGGPALAAAAKAREVILQNRAEFDRLTETLQRDGIGQVYMGPAPAVTGNRPLGPNAAAAAAAAARSLANGKQAGLPELRAMASEARAAGHKNMAVLLERSIAAAEGRDVEPLYERSYGGSISVVTR